MDKYEEVELKVFGVFDSQEWKAKQIKSFPLGFDGEKGKPPYLRISILYSGGEVGIHSTSGMLMIEIFTAWGDGPTTATQIAGKLNSLFEKKSFGNLQFTLSTLTPYSRDKDNSNLGRAIYSLPFTRFGVQ